MRMTLMPALEALGLRARAVRFVPLFQRVVIAVVVVALVYEFVPWVEHWVTVTGRDIDKAVSAGENQLPGVYDFPTFYSTGQAVADGKLAGIYKELGWKHEYFFRFYNPPAYAILLTPLTLLPIQQAYLLV